MVHLLPLVAASFMPTSESPILVQGMECHPRRLLVKLRPDQPAATMRWRGAKLKKNLQEIRWTIVEAPTGKLQQTKAALEQVPSVEQVCFDRVARPAYTPNDPMWPDQWSAFTMKADLAWDLSLGANSAIVAVIDTGVNVGHPDLQANIWVNSDEIPGNNIDDDSNGYIDDVNGYDFAYNDPDPNDVYGHGTPCAGIVGAVGDNGIGMSGIAPRARIMPLKACGDDGYFYDSMTAPAYLYAANNGARVLSMSYFSDRVSPIERDGIEYCWSHNVLPVAAAGNSSSVVPYYPGAYDHVLAVAAITQSSNKAGFSNYGAWVDVAAGGTGLVATAVGGGYTTGFGGTSGATPHIAGLAALLIGANSSATNAQVRAAIEDTASAVNQAPFGEYCNYGIANAQAAMVAILGSPAPPRTPVVRYLSMLGYQPNEINYNSDEFLVARIYGRGFQSPNTVTVEALGQPLPVLAQTRDYVEIEYLPPLQNPLQIRVNGNLVSSLTMPLAYRICYPMSEASTPSASTTGGFLETLAADSAFVRCTRQNDGTIFAQTTFHKVQVSNQMFLRLRRRYTSTNANSIESIRIYDWSSASYPYGNYVDLSVGAPPTAYSTVDLPLPNPARFLDDERTVYVMITTENMPSGSELRIDEMAIHSPN